MNDEEDGTMRRDNRRAFPVKDFEVRIIPVLPNDGKKVRVCEGW